MRAQTGEPVPPEGRKLTLDQPMVYEIKVPGGLDTGWTDWDGRVTITVEAVGDGAAVTTLTGTFDQAALQSLLRRLYALGLPLLSVRCIDCDP